LKAIDTTKDQTYFLVHIQQDMLRRCLFPIGDLYKKQDVRRIAHEANLHIASKKDSVGICFVGERNYSTFLGKPSHQAIRLLIMK
jgi:tRNA-specific 2-thiouridylase